MDVDLHVLDPRRARESTPDLTLVSSPSEFAPEDPDLDPEYVVLEEFTSASLDQREDVIDGLSDHDSKPNPLM